MVLSKKYHQRIDCIDIIIRFQSIRESLERSKYFAGNLDVFKKRGYEVILPSKYQNRKPLNLETIKEDYILLKTRWTVCLSEVIQLVQKRVESIKKVLSIFNYFHEKWGFNIFDQYELCLTPYGVHGSYEVINKNQGRIILRVPNDLENFIEESEFKTLVHEMVHLGIQNPIVNKYRLSHWEKERVVDKICILKFKGILPHYKMPQIKSKSLKKLDAYIDNRTLDDLPSAIRQYKQN